MATYFVSATGSDANSGLSEGAAFKTLAKAQAAMAASSGADTTLVESGTYTAGATLTSTNSGDTFRADAGATAVLDGGGNASTFFTINGASNVTISGLTFQNTATGSDNDTVRPAILVSSGNGEIIQGNTFRSLGSAVIVNAGTGDKIDSNSITDMGSVAIRLRGSATAETVSNNTIAHSSYDLPEGGAIEILGTGGSTITHNTIDDSAYNGIWDESSGNNAITWNKVTNSVLKASDGGGIYAFFPSSGDTIADNWVVNSLSNPNLNWGIYLDDNVNNTTVTGNYAQGGSGGVDIHGGDNVTVTDNILIGRDFGLTVMGTGDAGSSGLSDNTQINHNVISGQDAVAGFDWGSNNLSDFNVLIGTSSSQLGFDPGTVSQWQASGQDTHSLLDASLSGEVNSSGTIVAGSKATQLGIPQTDFSQTGSGGGSVEPPPPPPPPPDGGDGTVDNLALILAATQSGSAKPHFIVSVDGVQLGSGDVTTRYPGEQEIDFKHDWIAGSTHTVDITYTNDSGSRALWINDVGVNGHWTQDSWVKLSNTGDTFHAVVTV